MNVRVLSDDQLLSGIQSLLGSQRRLTALLLRYLAEVDDRRLHLLAACSSMFDFCTARLGMSAGEAFRRITGARLAQRFPVVLSLLENGRLHLSALCLLRDHLTEQNHMELFEEASGKSKRELEAMLAMRFPKPDVPSSIRKLVDRAPSGAKSDSLPLGSAAGATERPIAAALEGAASSGGCAMIEPLSAVRYKVVFTAGAELKDKLERAKNLMSHANPSGDLAVIVERGLDLLLAELERRKLGKLKRPRPSRSFKVDADLKEIELDGSKATDRCRAAPSAGEPAASASAGGSKPSTLADKGPRPIAQPGRRGAIRRAVRREVFGRDGVQCTFVDREGRRCQARAFLELDHTRASAHGGADDTENLRVLCHAHNQLSAELTFGREFIEAQIHLRQQKSASKRAPSEAPVTNHPRPDERPSSKPTTTLRASPLGLETTYAKLFDGLVGMGFRKPETRAAVERLKATAGAPDVPLEPLLRRALLLLTG